MVDIYSGGPSLLPDAPLVHKRSNDDLGWRRPKRKMSPARLPDDLRDEIDGFAGARATIATDRALPRALRVARWGAPAPDAPTAILVPDVFARLEESLGLGDALAARGFAVVALELYCEPGGDLGPEACLADLRAAYQKYSGRSTNKAVESINVRALVGLGVGRSRGRS